jgi:polysaccharide deacetylase family protein (PEP-CTERM system associated)
MSVTLKTLQAPVKRDTPEASPPPHLPSPGVVNALSFDVEDYYQVSNFESFILFEDWDRYESRVERNTSLILEILSEHSIRATFFVLGWVAEKHRRLVRSIADAGHELGSHSYRHRLIYQLSPEQFRVDLRLSIDMIEQVCGQKVLGHRAPSFSITDRSLWAIEIMQEEGLLYDSSIYPIRHHRYGIPSAPRAPFEILPGFWEFPMATARVGQTNVPMAGGGGFRIFPYALTRWGLRSINREALPAMVYMHPWEFDPAQARFNASLQVRFRHYFNLKKTAPRLRKLCEEFSFRPAREVLGL